MSIGHWPCMKLSENASQKSGHEMCCTFAKQTSQILFAPSTTPTKDSSFDLFSSQDEIHASCHSVRAARNRRSNTSRSFASANTRNAFSTQGLVRIKHEDKPAGVHRRAVHKCRAVCSNSAWSPLTSRKTHKWCNSQTSLQLCKNFSEPCCQARRAACTGPVTSVEAVVWSRIAKAPSMLPKTMRVLASSQCANSAYSRCLRGSVLIANSLAACSSAMMAGFCSSF
mmetsp:Transcript_42704/g.117871  ORF Transcript_42704/g.117871 Transcript_42704/m.117871 type:complete len:226 (-) Transcript_42704:376-1053(-)